MAVALDQRIAAARTFGSTFKHVAARRVCFAIASLTSAAVRTRVGVAPAVVAMAAPLVVGIGGGGGREREPDDDTVLPALLLVVGGVGGVGGIWGEDRAGGAGASNPTCGMASRCTTAASPASSVSVTGPASPQPDSKPVN